MADGEIRVRGAGAPSPTVKDPHESYGQDNPGPMLPELPASYWLTTGAREWAEWSAGIHQRIKDVRTINDLREIGDAICARARTFYQSADAWEPHGRQP